MQQVARMPPEEGGDSLLPQLRQLPGDRPRGIRARGLAWWFNPSCNFVAQSIACSLSAAVVISPSVMVNTT
eukprot:1871717-Alexandrium_andersonii.AAC.1